VLFLAGGIVTLAVVLGMLGVAVLVITWAPALPWLNKLPKVGAARMSVTITFGEPIPGHEELIVRHARTMPDAKVLWLRFVNDGRQRVESVLVNVLVDAAVEITACDHQGNPMHRGSAMSPTEWGGRQMNRWTEKDVDVPVGVKLLYYRLSFPDPRLLGAKPVVVVTYSADGLYGGERVCEKPLRVVDLDEHSGGEGQRPLSSEPARELREDRQSGVESDALKSTDTEGKE
jgi:hypothetical protein